MPRLWHYLALLCVFGCVDVCLLLWSYELIKGKGQIFFISLSLWSLALYLCIKSPQSLLIKLGKAASFKEMKDAGTRREGSAIT